MVRPPPRREGLDVTPAERAVEAAARVVAANMQRMRRGYVVQEAAGDLARLEISLATLDHERAQDALLEYTAGGAGLADLGRLPEGRRVAIYSPEGDRWYRATAYPLDRKIRKGDMAVHWSRPRAASHLLANRLYQAGYGGWASFESIVYSYPETCILADHTEWEDLI